MVTGDTQASSSPITSENQTNQTGVIARAKTAKTRLSGRLSGLFSKESKEKRLGDVARPDGLPRKSKEELAEHAKALAQMQNSWKKKEVLEKKRERAREREQESKEQFMHRAKELWENDILPDWENKRKQRSTHKLWRHGIPAGIRAHVWPLCIANDLSVTQETWDYYSQQASAAEAEEMDTELLHAAAQSQMLACSPQLAEEVRSRGGSRGGSVRSRASTPASQQSCHSRRSTPPPGSFPFIPGEGEFAAVLIDKKRDGETTTTETTALSYGRGNSTSSITTNSILSDPPSGPLSASASLSSASPTTSTSIVPSFSNAPTDVTAVASTASDRNQDEDKPQAEDATVSNTTTCHTSPSSSRPAIVIDDPTALVTPCDDVQTETNASTPITHVKRPPEPCTPLEVPPRTPATATTSTDSQEDGEQQETDQEETISTPTTTTTTTTSTLISPPPGTPLMFSPMTSGTDTSSPMYRSDCFAGTDSEGSDYEFHEDQPSYDAIELAKLSAAQSKQAEELLLRCDTVHHIHLDVVRTFPSLKLYKEGPFYESLLKILSTYAVYQPVVGYVQGMSYLAAMLQLYMDTLDVFVCLANLLTTKYHFIYFFAANPKMMNTCIITFDLAMKSNMPQLHAHFRDIDLRPSFYLTEWFITLFSRSLPLDVAAHIWDLFLLDQTYLYKCALGLLKYFHDDLMNASFEYALEFLSKMQQQPAVQALDHNRYFRIVLGRGNISRRKLRSIRVKAEQIAPNTLAP